MKTRYEGVRGWANFPLLNRDGDPWDVETPNRTEPGVATPWLAEFPDLQRILQSSFSDFVIHYARVAGLGPREILRPHRDSADYARLLFLFNEQGTHFRHLFGDTCVHIRPLEVWGVDGAVMHAAANIAKHGQRFALLLDVTPKPTPRTHWFARPWEIPDQAHVVRRDWDACSREKAHNAARQIYTRHGIEPLREFWRLLPFLFRMHARDSDIELHRFYRAMQSIQDTREDWGALAWNLEHPSLPFEVPVEAASSSADSRC